ncbi:threonine/serine exporter family protein [Nocardioides sp. CER19]|uniref:threonine/serine exporter family protein n=1 Tax=Nocardioides sp. CER19 TaxID=3038538 RepID=UPI00244A385C|nr:threonine/serine exporter family protein [Nocardioides sp. CER19]MDH2415996.1 threonine/serine exporter family protein [Nocardioides sp. CER19]
MADGFDVAVRVARLALASSAEGVERLERFVRRAAAPYGTEIVLVVLPEQVVLQEECPGRARSAVVRAAPGVFRLDQVAALKRALARIEDGMPAADACALLDGVEAQRPRWPWWVRALGVAMFAAGFAPSVVASWQEVGAASLLGLLMGLLVVGAGGTRAEGLVPFIGAFAVTVLGLTVLSDLSATTGVTLLVIPALFITVPGDTLSAAAGELLTGNLTAGAVRLVLALFVLGLIVVGIVAGAGVTGHVDALSETLPEPALPYVVLLAGWVVFAGGLVLAFNAEPLVFVWLVPSVIATYVLQDGATRLGGSVVGTLVAGAVLGAFANLVDRVDAAPPRLILVLGGFFVLTVGGLGVRGVTAMFGGDVVSGIQNLADFGLQVPTVALALALGVLVTDWWRPTGAARPHQ